MKKPELIFLVAVMVLLGACATTSDFPVSDIVPAAEITVKKKQEKNSNYRIIVNARNLASPDRLTPPANCYTVWINSSNGYRKVGQLTKKNARSATLESLVPFDFYEVSVTAERDTEISYPTGPEISRTFL